VCRDLHMFVKRREMSRFVADAVKQKLEVKKNDLREAYLAANEDEGQQEVLQDWEVTLSENYECSHRCS